MKLFRKPNSRFYWYDFTVRGHRYRGSTQETKILLFGLLAMVWIRTACLFSFRSLYDLAFSRVSSTQSYPSAVEVLSQARALIVPCTIPESGDRDCSTQ